MTQLTHNPHMHTVYYKPAEIIGLIGVESKEARTTARRKGHELSKSVGEQGWAAGIKQAAGAVWDLGRGAFADLLLKQAENTSYVLDEDSFEARNLAKSRKVPYSEVTAISAKSHDRFCIEYSGGSLTIKPIAHLVAGRFRVPIGWIRNGMEVPYTMLIEELAARCGADIEWE